MTQNYTKQWVKQVQKDMTTLYAGFLGVIVALRKTAEISDNYMGLWP